MCFHTHYDHQEVKTAEKDIVCWKYLTKDRKAPLQNFQYEYNILNKLGRPLEVVDREISEGFHSHSEKRIAKLRATSDRKVFKFIIPKGSKYFYNPNDEEYVSDHIVLINPWYNQSIVEYFRTLKNS